MKKIAFLVSVERPGSTLGIMRYAREANWICLRFTAATLPQLEAWKPDGILYLIDKFDITAQEFLASTPIPKVGLYRVPGLAMDHPYCLFDRAQCARAATRHLLSRNYRRLALVAPRWDGSPTGRELADEMAAMAEAAGVPLELFFPDEQTTWRRLGVRGGHWKTTDWVGFWDLAPTLLEHLAGHGEPVGVLVMYLEPTLLLVEVASELGIDIPGTLGLVARSITDPSVPYSRVSITTVRPNQEKQGFEAARLLDRWMRGEVPPVVEEVPDGELTEQESTGQIVTTNPLVRRALERIWSESHRHDLTPKMLAPELDVGLRTLQGHFRKALGRGVSDVIREQRTRTALCLIRGTDLPFNEIARRCGLGGLHQLARAVRGLTGQTPTELRKKTKEG